MESIESAQTREVAAYRAEWIRKRVEACADRGLENFDKWSGLHRKMNEQGWSSTTLFETAWRAAEALYDEGRKMGFLP
jgi:hypothetical protein